MSHVEKHAWELGLMSIMAPACPDWYRPIQACLDRLELVQTYWMLAQVIRQMMQYM